MLITVLSLSQDTENIFCLTDTELMSFTDPKQDLPFTFGESRIGCMHYYGMYLALHAKIDQVLLRNGDKLSRFIIQIRNIFSIIDTEPVSAPVEVQQEETKVEQVAVTPAEEPEKQQEEAAAEEETKEEEKVGSDH